jgi:hypothetical protein
MLVPPAPRSPQAFSSMASQIGHEVRLPHVIAGTHGDEVALARVPALLARALVEVEIVLEHEFLVVERVQHERQVGRRDEQSALAARTVEMPVLGVQRNREQALGPPFEAALDAILELDLRRARPLEHVVDVLVEVTLRRRRSARRDVEQEHVGEVAAADEMHRGALHAEARPHGGFDREQVDAVILGDLHAFLRDPVEIRIDIVAGVEFLRHLPSSSETLLRFKKTAAT